MLVQIKKGRDSRPTLVCIRKDGTRTWSQVHPFFPLHDLTHFAVESVLGFREGFFGLVESGWSIETFAEPAARRRMPAQALWAENIVGLLDLERGMQRRFPADELNRTLSDSLAQQHVPLFRALSEAELASVRALRTELDARWTALAPGETLEVSFP
ncbi:MAG: hypothetical protein ACREMV_02130 [Gemmatimonadales bacterium]